MSLLLTVVTVSAFDHTRLKRTLQSTKNLPDKVEHVCIIPEKDLESRNLLDSERAHGRNLKMAYDTNSGVYGAMNLGASIASGEYVIFWNSGDLLHSLSEFQNFLCDLENIKPIWALASGVHEDGRIHENSLEGLRNFRDQKPGSYVSHQVIASNRRFMFDVGLFDLNYKIAADTKMIHAFTRLGSPLVSHSRIVEIEAPQLSAKHHRRSRYETAKLAVVDLILRTNYKPLINVLRRELRLLRRIQ